MKKTTTTRKKRRQVFVQKSKTAASSRPPVRMKKLKSFPPDCNPYRHDLWRMGKDINERFLVMFDDHDGDSDHIILIEKPTGRRVRLTFEKEG